MARNTSVKAKQNAGIPGSFATASCPNRVGQWRGDPLRVKPAQRRRDPVSRGHYASESESLDSDSSSSPVRSAECEEPALPNVPDSGDFPGAGIGFRNPLHEGFGTLRL